MRAVEPGDIVGKSDYDLSPAFLADQFRIDDEYVLGGRRIVDRIELVGHEEGRAVWSVTSKVPLLDALAEVIGTSRISRRLGQTHPPGVTGAGFGAVLAYIRDHYHEPISNRQLARQAHLSVWAFERRFRASFHLTPQRYNDGPVIVAPSRTRDTMA